MEQILIGEILKPQGIRGEVKMKNFTDGFFAVKNLKEITIEGVRYQVLKMREDKGVFMLLKGVADRNAAELLRGKSVYADKSAVTLENGKYFISDVIGCDLYLSDGQKVGEITEILSAKVDIYYISRTNSAGENEKMLFPLIKELNPVFDIENNRVTVDKTVFLREVINY
ncbi:MAG: ribosome maturation factor RimM [Candidatus Borkfalkiaceae bacterium]|nr:ribosome maturation factor RimM [Christensenellaceae bacterium]